MDRIDLSSERLYSRPWVQEDEQWFVEAVDSEVRRYTRMPRDVDPRSWFESDALHPPSGSTSAALVLSDGTVIGNVGARSMGAHTDLSYWIGAEHRGEGYATEALGALTRWAAEALGTLALELEITPDNLGSIAVAERNGYRRQGLRSSCSSCADASGQVAVYRITADSIPSPPD